MLSSSDFYIKLEYLLFSLYEDCLAGNGCLDISWYAGQIAPLEAVSFICACVSHLTENVDLPAALPVAHALLDCLPALAASGRPLPQEPLCMAAALYWRLLNPEHARLAVKLAQASCSSSCNLCHAL